VSAPARPPEGRAPSLGEDAAQRQEGSPANAPARPPQGRDENIAPHWRDVRRLLCVRLDNMGDVLMTSPALRALKQSLPGCRLSLLASPAGAQAARFVPEVDEIAAFDAAWVRNAAAGSAADRRMLAWMRAGRFDAAAIFTVYSQSALPAALMCHLAGISLVLAHVRENPYRLVSDWVRETEPGQGVRHEVRRQLDLVARIGARTGDTRLSFAVGDGDRRGLRRALREAGVAAAGGWIVAHCGASAPSRRYPPQRYVEALARLAGEGRGIVLTGGQAERELTAAIAAGCAGAGVVDLAGRLTLGELGALIERAGVLVSNNSGPVHIAAALGTPVVDLYALTNPQHTPWQVPHRLLYRDVPCKYCYRSVCPQGHHACLAGVPPGAVARAARELLQAAPMPADAAAPVPAHLPAAA